MMIIDNRLRRLKTKKERMKVLNKIKAWSGKGWMIVSFIIYHLSFSPVGALLSCDLETSDNGKLDGLWQLTTIDTLNTGGTTDVRQNSISWAFQGKLLEVRNVNEMRDVIYRFNHTEGSLKLSDPYISEREEGDIKLDNTERLRIYGISQLEPNYRILQLGKNRMCLEDGTLRLSFRKY